MVLNFNFLKSGITLVVVCPQANPKKFVKREIFWKKKIVHILHCNNLLKKASIWLKIFVF